VESTSAAIFCLVFFENIFSASEEKGDTPERRQAYDCVNDSAYEVCLTAEQPAYNIKFEKTDAAPVQTAYNKKN
jgi:hypothetical protein